MSLRDELFHALVSGTVKESDGAAWQYNAIEAAAILDGLMPTIDRALAAERAATIEEVQKAVSDLMARTLGQAYKVYSPGLKDTVSLLRTLHRNRPALDDMLIKAEETGWSKAVSETIQHFSAGPQSGCGCAYCDPRTRYGNALVQARREQQQKDADKLDAMAAQMAYSSGDPSLGDRDADAMLEDSSAYQRAAAAIRAQED